MNTAERLKELREKYNFSQHRLANHLNVAPSLISAYERGERMPSPAKLIQLADIYHTTTDYLLCRKNMEDENLYLSLEGLSPLQIKLLREFIDTIRQNQL